MKLKDFLRIGRSQTIPATTLLLTVAFLLGGGELFSLTGLAVIVIAMFGHIASFGHNSVMDSSIVPEIGYGKTVDESDSSKGHHPIISGRVTLREAHITFHCLLTSLIGLAGLLAILTPGNSAYALLFLLIWVAFGYAYNNGMSIFSIWKWYFISLCFVGLFFYAYFLHGTYMTQLAVLAGIYVFIRIWIQNGAWGELKDISAPEYNMLEKLGAKVLNGTFVPSYAKYYGGALTVTEVAVGLYILYVVPFNYVTASVALVLMGVGSYLSYKMIVLRTWKRDRELKKMGLCEIAFIYALVVMLTPVIGYVEGILLMAFGVLWFFGMNKYLWGTDHPDV